MARTITQIQGEIAAQILADKDNASTSRVAGWRLWARVVAGAINAFEVILDLFRREVEDKVSKIAPGSLPWWRDMCLRFQNGHEVKFNPKTAELYYEVDDPAARIIEVVAITEGRNSVTLKVAKLDDDNHVVPLDIEEMGNFDDYIAAINFAGLGVSAVSLPSDLIRYDIEVFYNPAYPAAIVEENVRAALAEFRIPQTYDAKFYPQQMEAKILTAAGVVTTDMNSVEQKKATEENYTPVGLLATLWAGFFEYAEDSVLTMTSINSVGDGSEG
jgi:hypothetical protein